MPRYEILTSSACHSMLLHYTYQIFLPALCIQKYLVWISCGTDPLFCPDACFSSLVCQDLPCIAILELLFQAAFFQQKLSQPFDRQPLHLLLISQIINPGYKITDRRLRDILDPGKDLFCKAEL